MDALLQRQKTIRDNYECVLENISQAATRTGRKTDDIQLVVVTKTQPVELIQAVIDAGADELGENYVEEALPKIQQLRFNPNLRWHMIGHLQSRKAETACEYFQYLHSLDSVKLADRLDRFSGQLNKKMPVWLEFNIGGEESKSGWDLLQEENWQTLLPEIEHILALSHLNTLGVMTIPPYAEDPEASRPYFTKLRKFEQYVVQQLHLDSFQGLSIGMSADYEVAIEEGSTCVRIGQAIFGPRTG